MIQVQIHFINNERITFNLDSEYNFRVTDGYAYLYNGDTEEEFYYPLHFISKIFKYPVDNKDTK